MSHMFYHFKFEHILIACLDMSVYHDDTPRETLESDFIEHANA